MSNQIIKATESNFENIVIQSKVPVLVDFWAPWCGPCLALNPTLEMLAQEFSGKAKIVKIDVDESPKLVKRFSVRGIPHLIIIKNGEEVSKLGPVRSRNAITDLLSLQIEDRDEVEYLKENLEDPDRRLKFFGTAPVEDLITFLDENPEMVDAEVTDGTPTIRYFITHELEDRRDLFLARGAKLQLWDLLYLQRIAEFMARLEADPSMLTISVDGDEPAILVALECRNESVLKDCLAMGGDLNELARTHAHSLYKNIVMWDIHFSDDWLQIFIDHGLDCSIETHFGMTAFHYAAVHDNAAAIRLLACSGYAPEQFAQSRD